MSDVTEFVFTGKNLRFRYTKGNANVYRELQVHPYCELYFFCGKRAEYSGKNAKVALEPFTLVPIAAGSYHRFVPIGDIRDYERFIIDVFPGFEEYEALDKAIRGKETLSFSASDRFTRHLYYLKDVLEKGADFDRIFPAVATDMVYIVKASHTASSVPVSENVARAVMDYIDEHFKDSLTLVALAEKFHYSVSRIEHVFKGEYGISVKNYVLQKRLNAVQSEIMRGARIQEVSREYGFEHYPAFYRVYKKVFGTSPRASKNFSRKT